MTFLGIWASYLVMFYNKLLFLLPALLLSFSSPSFGQEPEAESLLQSVISGKQVFERECSTCHPVERALLADYGDEEWLGIVSKMLRGKEGIAEAEEASVALFLSGGSSFNRNCVTCHTRDRCFSRSMSFQNWTMTVRKMKLRIEDGISQEESGLIAAYLAASCPEK